jgi:hypothetical protein
MAVEKILYKSETMMVYLTGFGLGPDLEIKKWSPKKVVNGFYWKNVAMVFINDNKPPNIGMTHKYHVMFYNEKDGIDPNCANRYFNDLKDLNGFFEEEIFNEESLAKYDAHMVAKRLMRSK